MAFKPNNASTPRGDNDSSDFVAVFPKAGNRRARVSLIVDLGEQNREPVWKKDGAIVAEGTEGAEQVDQKPCQQVAVFADLVNDTVDYGGEIGKAHYRLMLNKSFKGAIQGINFAATPPINPKTGKIIEGKPWGLHPNSVLSKLANAIGKPDIIDTMDIEGLLGEQFQCEVEVKSTEDKNGKKDKDGNVLVYTNVNYKGCASVPAEIKEVDGEEVEIVPTFAELKVEAKAITFANATKDDIKFLRAGVIRKIKEANDYEGSNMQKAIEEYEAEKGNKTQDNPEEGKVAPAKSKPTPKPAEKKPVPQADPDDDIPF